MRHEEETHKATKPLKPKNTCTRIYKSGPPNLVGSCEISFSLWVGGIDNNLPLGGGCMESERGH